MILKNKDMKTAIEYGRKGVQQAPNDSGRHYMLCLALCMGEEFEEAVGSCETAVRLAPFRPVNYVLQLAWSLVGTTQYDKSIPLFKEVIDRSPQSIHKRRLSVHAGVLALRNPRRSLTTPAVAKSLRPWPEPQSTISGWTLSKIGARVKTMLTSPGSITQPKGCDSLQKIIVFREWLCSKFLDLTVNLDSCIDLYTNRQLFQRNGQE
jgi:tetratricopeptide (TPR) repeat protein